MSSIFHTYRNENIVNSGFLFIETGKNTLYQVNKSFIPDIHNEIFTGAISPQIDQFIKEYNTLGKIWVMPANTTNNKLEANKLTRIIKGHHASDVNEDVFEKVFNKNEVTDIFTGQYGITLHPFASTSKHPLIKIEGSNNISLYSIDDISLN